MKNLKSKFNSIKENDIIKSFFIIIYVVICLLLFINQYNIQYLASGFSAVDNKNLQVYFLDVGQASSTVVVLPNDMVMVIDTGSSDSERDFIESVNTILARNKINQIDYLILTHSDEDHVGGAEILLKEYQVYNIFRPKILSVSASETAYEDYQIVTTQIYQDVITAVYEEPNCVVEFIDDKSIMAGNDTYINFYACKQNSYVETNDYSPFINLIYQNKSFLFCGDASQDREEELIEFVQNNDITLNIDFLLVGHHGSKYSTSSEFLSLINPKYAFVSAGDSLHPSNEVIERLKDCGVEEIYCTKTDGMIGVGVDGEGKFVIKTMNVFVDVPLIFVLFSCLFFYLYPFINKLGLNKRKNGYFEIKNLIQ